MNIKKHPAELLTTLLIVATVALTMLHPASRTLADEARGNKYYTTATGATIDVSPCQAVNLDTTRKVDSSRVDVDADGTLAGNSDVAIASQKAVKTYADTKSPLAGSASITTVGTLATGNIPAGLITSGNLDSDRMPTDWTGAASITTIGTIATGTVPQANVSGLTTLDTPQFSGVKLTGLGGNADVNTLDYYKQGTFTPALAYSTPGDASFTYAGQAGKYTRIGNIVYVSIEVRLSAFAKGTGAGTLKITGLPAASFATSFLSIGYYYWPLTSTAGLIAYIDASATVVTLQKIASNNVFADIDDPDSDSMVWVTGFYFTE